MSRNTLRNKEYVDSQRTKSDVPYNCLPSLKGQKMLSGYGDYAEMKEGLMNALQPRRLKKDTITLAALF